MVNLNFKLFGPTSAVTGGKVTVPVEYRRLSSSVLLLQFPLFNFTTVSNGQILKGKLPLDLRPRKNQEFKCSTNDNELIAFTFDTAPAFPSSDVAYFVVSIKKKGTIRISGMSGSFIPAGSHTFNSQSIQYRTSNVAAALETCSSKTYRVLTQSPSLDANLYPLTGTDFTVKLRARYLENQRVVKVSIPSFPFTISDAIDPMDPAYPETILIPGGMLQSTGGYLSSKIRPSQIQTAVTSDLQFNVSLDTYVL